ncbi:PBECR4 domain-containing protein [Paenibacillus odorifer]|uniref:PBECR4 domain-containing protein n=1 Tax=Paenibacillus odorifer TaxID=189426 RepID=UPI00096F70D6|nr:PBECR4 domain-containing protein [Paenibacillus odorifer]OMD08206.1 hypothetical protein BJP47_30090 [Paenibacillus odorifer]
MLLSVQDLLSIQAMPTEDELTLQTMAIFYEEWLCDRQFLYSVSHKCQEIRLRFKPGDLCHLLGIQHILKGMENSGERGFRAMKEGRLTLQSLKKANVGGYADMLYRMLYFPFVYQLIQDPKIVIENQHNSTSIVKAQFIFYDHYGEHYIELKLRQENKDTPNFFVPVTFSAVRKIKPRNHVTIKGTDILDYNAGYKP